MLPRKWLVLGGEALRPRGRARTLVGAGTCRVLNHYGPTETTVGVLTHEVTPASLDAARALGAQTVPLGATAGEHAGVRRRCVRATSSRSAFRASSGSAARA